MIFSVIIPLYNKAAIVSETLQSVLNQICTDYEIIIVNDGSTDNGLDIVKSIGDHRIRVFSKNNGGVSSARNFGIKQAKGQYIAFLDADDLWEPNYLSEIYNLIIKYPGCGIYSCGFIMKKKYNSLHTQYNKEGIIENYFEECFKNKILYCNASCVIIPKNVFSTVGLFPEDICAGEDSFMWIKIAKHYKVCVSTKYLCTYRYMYTSQAIWKTQKYPINNMLFFNLYEQDNFYLNELIAWFGINRAIGQAMVKHKEYSRLSEKLYSYTKRNRKSYLYLQFLNRTPNVGINIISKGWKVGSILKSLSHKYLKE